MWTDGAWNYECICNILKGDIYEVLDFSPYGRVYIDNIVQRSKALAIYITYSRLILERILQEGTTRKA